MLTKLLTNGICPLNCAVYGYFADGSNPSPAAIRKALKRKRFKAFFFF
jgi:hypothetical protein